MENKEVNIKLTVNELNFILDVIGEKPFKTVKDLISKIVNQGNEQIKPQENGN